ncbi:hypothetical protein RchiOBHm_Chr5g0082031 [Rosa chinensis]|uniref:Uncharacterized protein n=1 Tax=Rosa chinensis TaxID=74649 RepID=A0A2P6QN77_ROSCH|nr:hypothetical protein RchiOBHm_Chr5g0082031 [Rosa chinensis]
MLKRKERIVKQFIGRWLRAYILFCRLSKKVIVTPSLVIAITFFDM